MKPEEAEKFRQWQALEVLNHGSIDFRPTEVAVWVEDGDIVCAPTLETSDGLYFLSLKLRLNKDIADQLTVDLFTALNDEEPP